jgi:phage tail protein X
MPKTYTTKQGDMWDSIALSELGSTSLTDVLMTMNQDKLKYYTFPAGIVLTLPEIDTASETETDSLPPWKKVSL